MKNRLSRVGMLAGIMALSHYSNAATTADVLFVVDESGSMAGEHAWIRNMVNDLDSELIGAGVTNNRYGLIGFGASNGAPHAIGGHGHTVGSGQWGSAADLSAAASGLVTSGNREDGYDGINFGLSNYQFRSGAAVNVILITDEDRDVVNNTLTFDGIRGALGGKSALLNAVVDGDFTGSAGTALGIDSRGNSFRADGSGGYTTGTGGSATGGSGTTVVDYVNLALATGGAAWDLSQLRLGGNTAQSFTDAFVDIKVGEIQQQPVPLPAALPMLTAGLVALNFIRRRKAA